MFYPHREKPSLTDELFHQPPKEYRGAPFFSLNCKLEKDVLENAMACMKSMGMGGYQLHSRSGLATPYLGDEFMQRIGECVEFAEKNDMFACLYDEDRWPSGAAGGLATHGQAYRSRYLLFTPLPYGKGKVVKGSPIVASRSEAGTFLASYEVELDEQGFLAAYRRLQAGEVAEKGLTWYAYVENSPNDEWFNNASSLNVMDPAAVRHFINITHEHYYAHFKDAFGKAIPTMFTDEPQTVRHQTLGFAKQVKDMAMPFTDDLPDTFAKVYGFDLMDHFPQVVWDLPDQQISHVRYAFYDHVSERFAAAFSDQIGKWCDDHGVMLTGHMMAESTLSSQTGYSGEAMRALRGFQLPGIDMLRDARELTTAKQAQSVARQYGRPGTMSELYGVTGWDFDFRGFKLQGDWQAALGVCVRVPHLYWASMAGEAKRDYPGSIGHQAPWHEHFHHIEDHFSRLNTALTRGEPIARVGVIHPIESYWLHCGPKDQNETICQEMDEQFTVLPQWLLRASIDFDYICESLLPDLYQPTEKGLTLGAMTYQAVVVPFCQTMRSTTLKALETFAQNGGKVVFAGQVPTHVDAKPSSAVIDFAAKCTVVPFAKNAILQQLEQQREVDIRTVDGLRSDNLLHQLRQDGERKWLFLSHLDHPLPRNTAEQKDYRISIKGHFAPTVYDTLTGTITACPAVWESENTIIEWHANAHDSLLLSLDAGTPTAKPVPPRALSYAFETQSRVPVTLLEKNALLLDMASYALDDEPFCAPEEVLRLDNVLRDRLDYPMRNKGFAQPWCMPTPAIEHTVRLRFSIVSEIEVTGALLAVENAADIGISLNGHTIDTAPCGHFVDKAIDTVPLPAIPAGVSTLELTIPFGPKSDLEWCYILGDFGVRVEGRMCTMIAPVKALSFGDITHQGLPFYTGNLIYHTSIEGNGKELVLRTPQFLCPALDVALDDQKKGLIAFSPYELSLGVVSKGQHALDITMLGSRENAFRAFHHTNDAYTSSEPSAWRSLDDLWTYEYRVKTNGVLVTPRLYTPADDHA